MFTLRRDNRGEFARIFLSVGQLLILSVDVGFMFFCCTYPLLVPPPCAPVHGRAETKTLLGKALVAPCSLVAVRRVQRHGVNIG